MILKQGGKMTIVTRFAPSPTGYLHIGGARTALFNYLYSRKCRGRFLLRIEDTDLERSTKEAVDAIINGLDWLGLTPDEPPVFQMQRQKRHIEAGEHLLQLGRAYKCYCTKEELEERRKQSEAQGNVYVYDGRCRDLTETDKHKGMSYAIRVKVNKEGSTIIHDLVMGKIEVNNSQLDDLIILRSDSVPTYMFAVVVDDHDMGITHVIRGDDHLTNAFRQYQIYTAFGWSVPEFAHLPLIHSQDGGKLSKRKGAVAVEDYRDMGFLPQAIRNYLLKLGWSHGNDEIISDAEAIDWFHVKDINKSPAKFDMVKLTSINHHYIKISDNESLLALMEYFINKYHKDSINPLYRSYLLQGLTSIKERSKTVVDLVNNSLFYILQPSFHLESNIRSALLANKHILQEEYELLQKVIDWEKDNLYQCIKSYCESKGMKLNQVVEVLRIAITSQLSSAASNFEIMAILGKEETLFRIEKTLQII